MRSGNSGFFKSLFMLILFWGIVYGVIKWAYKGRFTSANVYQAMSEMAVFAFTIGVIVILMHFLKGFGIIIGGILALILATVIFFAMDSLQQKLGVSDGTLTKVTFAVSIAFNLVMVFNLIRGIIDFIKWIVETARSTPDKEEDYSNEDSSEYGNDESETEGQETHEKKGRLAVMLSEQNSAFRKAINDMAVAVNNAKKLSGKVSENSGLDKYINDCACYYNVAIIKYTSYLDVIKKADGEEISGIIDSITHLINAMREKTAVLANRTIELADKNINNASADAGDKSGTDIGEALFAGCKSRESVAKRHRDLLKLFHPDNQDGDNEMTLKIQRAYEAEIKKFL